MMQTVQFSEYGDSSVLEVTDVDDPTPGPNEVRIEASAIGINFKDIRQRKGLVPVDNFPFTPGMEVAGTIDAVGGNVDREVGDNVVARVNNSAYAEKVIAPNNLLFDIPGSLSFTEAAAFPVQFLTAYGVLFNRGDLQAGDKVLIHAAAGGVGTAAVQLARIAGAEIFATASTDEKLELAGDLGADYLINYSTCSFHEEINKITGGEGVDLILDGVGGKVFKKSLDSLASYGNIVTYGAASGDPGTIEDSTRLYAGNNGVLGFHLTNTIKNDPERILSAVSQLSTQLEEEDLRVVVGKTFPLDQAGRAHDYIETRKSVGKTVLLP